MILHQEKKNGLIVLVEIGVFLLRREKMGQWAGTSSYNKTPQVPKDEKKKINYVGKWVVNDVRE